MSKERRQLTKSCTDLLEYSAGDLIPMLEAEKELLHVKQSAFEYYSAETEEVFQVHVTVTRSESDFLEFMQIEHLAPYVHKSSVEPSK